MHKTLYKTGNKTLRRNFILQFCCYSQHTNGRIRFEYSLPRASSVYVNGEKSNKPIPVCRRFFIAATSLTVRIIRYTLLEKQSAFGVHVESEKGGIHHNRKHSISEEQYQEIIGTLNGVQTWPSHYGRKNSKAVYFDSTKSIAGFYREYKKNLSERRNEFISMENIQDYAIPKPPVSYESFR